MGGFFGTVSTKPCINDLFYGTDYNSHLGTMRGGMSTYSKENGFIRSIHNLESTYFRSTFEDELDKFKGEAGIGIISDTDAQPLLMNSHLGRFAIVTVAKVNNKEVHMRISCPPLIYGCQFINFSRSQSDMELITRRVIKDFEGDENKNLDKYTETDSPEYCRMVEEIGKRLNLTSLKFSKLETLIESIGLPKCQICTHCFDGSSEYTLQQNNTQG